MTNFRTWPIYFLNKDITEKLRKPSKNTCVPIISKKMGLFGNFKSCF